MNVGGLNIELAMNIARLQRDVNQATAVVTNFASTATKALSAIGVGLSIAGIVALGKSTIDAISKMKELGQEAGTTASAISRFEAPARAAGSSLEAVAGAMFRVSKAALEARDPTSNAAQALKAIGISAQEIRNLKPDELFEKIARQLAKYSDGIDKNNIMQVLFNKSGKEMSRVVAEIAERGKLLATVTDEEADAANRFNSQLTELKMNSEKTWRSLISEGIPALNEILKAFIKAKEEGGFLNGVFAAMDVTLSKMRGDKWTDELDRMNAKIGVLRGNIDRWRNMGPPSAGNFWTGLTEGEMADKLTELNKLLLEREAIEKRIHADEMRAQDARAVTGQTPGKPAPTFDPKALEEARKALEIYKAENVALDQQIAKLRGVGEVEAYISKLEEEKYKNLTPKQKEELTDKMRLLVSLQQEKEAREAILKTNKELMESQQRLRDIEADYALDLRKLVADEQFQLTLIGKSSDQAVKLNAIRQLDLDLQRRILEIEKERGGDLSREDTERINRMREQNELAKQAVGLTLDQAAAKRQELSAWNELADRAAQFFDDMLFSGKTAIESLRDLIKNLLRDLVALFARRWVLSLGASLAGGGVGDALAGQAAQSGLGSLAGSLLGDAGTFLFGSPGATSVTGLAEPGVAGLLGSFGSLSSILGPLAVGIGLLVSFLGRRGGPKEEGTFGQTSILSGTNDPELRQIGEALGNGFAETLRRLGGTSTLGPNPFSLGLSSDPHGTSPTFLDAIVRNAQGQDIYRNELRNVGRGAEEIKAALDLEAKRALLAALQASDIPEDIAAILKSIDPLTASAADIDRVTAAALAFADAAAEAAATAAAAAEQMKTDWEQAQDLLDRLSGRDPSLRHLSDAASAFGAANPWAASLSPAELVAAFKTITEEDFKAYSAENRQLILAILGLADTMDATAETVADAAHVIAQAIYLPEVGANTLQGDFETRYGGLISSAPGLMGQMSLRSQLMSGQVATWMQQQSGLSEYSAEYQTLQKAIDDFKQKIAATGIDIARLTVLTAQYGESKAEELFNLEKWYEAQKALVEGNREAMDALQKIFGDKWKAIIDGIASDDSKNRLADWWRGLFLDKNLSPLTLTQKLDEARRQYEAAKAGGNLGDIQGSAQTLLELLRQRYGSSADYLAGFREIATDVGRFAGISEGDINQRLYGALPTSGTIMTSADAGRIESRINDLIGLIQSGEVSFRAPKVEQGIDRLVTETQSGSRAGALTNG